MVKDMLNSIFSNFNYRILFQFLGVAEYFSFGIHGLVSQSFQIKPKSFLITFLGFSVFVPGLSPICFIVWYMYTRTLVLEYMVGCHNFS